MTTFQIIAVSLGAVALLAAGTMLLPRHVEVERRALIDADAQTVLALAASGEGYQHFNPYKVSDPDLSINLFGPQSGVGSGFHFKGREGKGSQTVAQVTPDAVHYSIDLGPMGRPTQAIHAVPQPGGAEVTWTMQADMGFNPIGRIMGLFMDRMMGPVFERGLSRLEIAA
ncbi:polyketide cyclase [Aliishimia ponticola]|uniref:Polyketide cyclase n=1 Tax=Aliishimia ponticola TaxID=2499833 RepID=A0A4V3XL22_9RHOB|nr:SRPBCC family protein [Aliishimia ponticola]THH39113.1 polyketide cyclase [Aliishimia ponticola]